MIFMTKEEAVRKQHDELELLVRRIVRNQERLINELEHDRVKMLDYPIIGFE